MTAVVLVFSVHQPFRLRNFGYLEIGASARTPEYFDDAANESILRRVAERCYRPMNALLLEAIERTEGRFRCAFSISGTALQQLERWAPEALEGFVALAHSGCVEFLAEPDHRSLASLAGPPEFEEQILAHRDRIGERFGRRPTTARNSGLILDNGIAERLAGLGFEVLLGEGADRLLAGRNPRAIWRVGKAATAKVLLRDHLRSDDLAFGFGEDRWSLGPHPAATFARRLRLVSKGGLASEKNRVAGIFLDYETFGEHRDESSGILDFMRSLPLRILEEPGASFATPAEAAAAAPPEEELDAPEPFSGSGPERDLSPWLGNHLQRAAHEALQELAPELRRAAGDHAPFLETWRRLTTSDHLSYMSTEQRADMDLHRSSSPHQTPHDAFITFMNVLSDLAERVREALSDPHE
jgi:alpha-amylase